MNNDGYDDDGIGSLLDIAQYVNGRFVLLQCLITTVETSAPVFLFLMSLLNAGLLLNYFAKIVPLLIRYMDISFGL